MLAEVSHILGETSARPDFGLSRDEIACIVLYKESRQLYHELNDALRSDDWSENVHLLPILKLLLSSLYKLPLVTKPLLFRGKIGNMTVRAPQTLTFMQFVSATTELNFRDDRYFSDPQLHYTLLYLRDVPAVDISSFRAQEKGGDEWLMLPGTSVKVDSVDKAANKTVIAVTFRKSLPQPHDFPHPQWHNKRF
jgi:hypothetical protein